MKTLINRVKEKYINTIKNKFFCLKDIKVIKKEIELLGFKTSRIYGYKNVKRMSAQNTDKNR